jgi:hypothetical protein
MYCMEMVGGGQSEISFSSILKKSHFTCLSFHRNQCFSQKYHNREIDRERNKLNDIFFACVFDVLMICNARKVDITVSPTIINTIGRTNA